jgi:hypothetical protein
VALSSDRQLQYEVKRRVPRCDARRVPCAAALIAAFGRGCPLGGRGFGRPSTAQLYRIFISCPPPLVKSADFNLGDVRSSTGIE